MKNKAETPYNQRLFDGGLRRRLHLARFIWLEQRLTDLGCRPQSVLELGCFDGKLIDYLPAPPMRYRGFDANWEGGLDLARQRFAGHPTFTFHQCTRPEQMELAADERFDVSVAMETFEHLPPELVDPYLAKLAAHTAQYLFVTVPNEKGPLFLVKWLTKRVLSGDAAQYTPAELLNATLGRSHKVTRREHKGFDYDRLVEEIDRHFEVIDVSGHPLGFLPCWLTFGVGIVGRAR